MTKKEAINGLKFTIGWFLFNPYTGKKDTEPTSFTDKLIVDICKGAIDLLEQESKTGHWILTDVEGDRIWRCNCSECGKDILDYIYGSEDWWLTYGNLPKFCPTCGSRNF